MATTKPVNQLKYVYEPLRTHEFRIIKIHRNDAGSLSATMIRVDLNSAPGYVALSYAWGDLGDTRILRVNGRDVRISVSLYEALQAISQSKAHSENVMVWADALCIDQSNLEERNQQVRVMTPIYQNAQSVAIWLGPRKRGDECAQVFLKHLLRSKEPIKVLLDAPEETLFSVASLFSRPYWSRLWVVQEIYNARNVLVYYGDLIDAWSTFQYAAVVFQSENGKRLLDELLPLNSGRESLSNTSPDHLSSSQILMYQGPGSFGGILGFKAEDDVKDRDRPAHEVFQRLLEVMRLSRVKKATEFRDRVFAILGVLPERIRDMIKVDYSASLRDIYTDVFDLVAGTTGSLDIICESIHFPLYRGVVDLPSWLPDWSHTPMVSSLAAKYPGAFHAHAGTWAEYSFEDHRRNRICIEAMFVGTVHTHGIALNTGCRANDYIRAFESWRLELMNHFRPASADTEDESAWEGQEEERMAWIAKEEEFCRTISLGKAGKADCYPIFAALIQSRFPYQPLDAELRRHADRRGSLTRADRQLLQDNFAENMMGRCFCVTNKGDLGLGSGFMCHGDLVVVALGCRTPIILRPQGRTEDGIPVHRFVGDIYLHGYMDGEAFQDDEVVRKKRHGFLVQ